MTNNAEYLLASVIYHLKERIELYKIQINKKYEDPYVNGFNHGISEAYKECLILLGAIPAYDE